jgi:serine/threonine protein kinase
MRVMAKQQNAERRLAGRYDLIRELGSGGMGAVWEAEDQLLGRRVAVKVLGSEDAKTSRAVRRFRREARSAARLSGPHIATVYDVGEDAGSPYLVMELVDGETLADRLTRKGRLDPHEAAWTAAAIADALEIAHREGVVHRDVKPANVMVTTSGEVKVMDFGIAAAVAERDGPTDATTSVDGVVGTPSYLSPEQARGEPVTPRSDVYALGAVLYEMLGGRPPFVRSTPVATALAHVHDDPQPIEELVPDAPPQVAAACAAALAKDPADRPASGAAFAAALRGATIPLPAVSPERDATAPIAGPIPSASGRGSSRQHPAVFVVALGLAAVAVVAVFLALSGPSIRKELRHDLPRRSPQIVVSSPAPTPAPPSAATGSEGPGNGNGHAYGHDNGNGEGD